MKTVDSLLGITKAILARAGAAATAVVALPIFAMPIELRTALAAAGVWLTGSAVWIARNRVAIDSAAELVTSEAVKVGNLVDPKLTAQLSAEVATASAKVDVLLAGLSAWAEAQDVPVADPVAVV